jgi:hypothetical protein
MTPLHSWEVGRCNGVRYLESRTHVGPPFSLPLNVASPTKVSSIQHIRYLKQWIEWETAYSYAPNSAVARPCATPGLNGEAHG